MVAFLILTQISLDISRLKDWLPACQRVEGISANNISPWKWTELAVHLI